MKLSSLFTFGLLSISALTNPSSANRQPNTNKQTDDKNVGFANHFMHVQPTENPALEENLAHIHEVERLASYGLHVFNEHNKKEINKLAKEKDAIASLKKAADLISKKRAGATAERYIKQALEQDISLQGIAEQIKSGKLKTYSDIDSALISTRQKQRRY